MVGTGMLMGNVGKIRRVEGGRAEKRAHTSGCVHGVVIRKLGGGQVTVPIHWMRGHETVQVLF